MNDNTSPQFSDEGENGISIAADDERIDSTKQDQVVPSQSSAPTKKRSKLLPFFAFLLVAGLIAFAVTQLDFTSISDTLMAIGYDAGAELSTIIDDLELTDDGLRILKATRPELQEADVFRQSCISSNKENYVLGCYTDQRIYLFNITNVEFRTVRQSTLAHELLHAVWERMSKGERDKLSPLLDEVYSKHEELQDHMDAYEAVEFYNELHSVVGTQLRADAIPEELAKHYAKYFRNQDKIVDFFDGYYAKYAEANKKADELYNKIQDYRQKYDELRDKYEADAEQLEADAVDFNHRASERFFQTYEEYERERNALVARKNALIAQYNELVDMMKEGNAMIAEYNSYVNYGRSMLNAFNSNVSKPDDEQE